jgi:hypothetical protein
MSGLEWGPPTWAGLEAGPVRPGGLRAMPALGRPAGNYPDVCSPLGDKRKGWCHEAGAEP